MNNDRIWPEGMQFTKTVDLPTKDEPLPVEIVFTVPAFDVVVETHHNTDPERAFYLFRQYLVSWDQQETMTDAILKSYLVKFPGSGDVIFKAWSDWITGHITARQASVIAAPQSVN
ncbi:hypothetical protein G5574_12530 [Pantoea stewartii]|uniref:hypothetical protein n=1 Tax=Pantoea stewartii TaxID=66269 RepID=UPI0013DE661E|nr:hypothetical protein [Pantoea stewartii]QIE97737.1 hypothetical protein G5574_12530 [Pantoea stewartii]